MFVKPWTFFLLSCTELHLNSFETLSVMRNSSPFWVRGLQTPKATFTTRYVQTYFTFLLVPPNKWCPTVYCGAVGYLVRKISLMSYTTTWKNLEKQDKVVTWTWDGALFFPPPQLSLQFRCTLCAQTCRQYPWTSSWTEREKKPLDLQPPTRVRPQKPKREFNSCWS